MNKKMIVIMKFNFKNYIKSAPFKLIAFIGIVLILGLFNIDKITDLFSTEHDHNIIIISENGYDFLSDDNLSNLSSDEISYKMDNNNNNVDYYLQEINKSEPDYQGFLYLNRDTNKVELYYLDKIDMEHQSSIIATSNYINEQFTLNNLGYSQEEITEITDTEILIYPQTTHTISSAIVSMIAPILIFFIVFIYVTSITNSIFEEKTSKISETLLSYATGMEILLGKILGIFLAILLHMLIFTVTIFISNLIFVKSDMLVTIFASLDIKLLIMVISIIVFAYLNFAFITAAFVSKAEDIQDGFSTTIIQMLLLVISFYISFFLGMNFSENIAAIISYIPVISVFSNITYIINVDLAWLQIIRIIILNSIYLVIIAITCARMFERRIAGNAKKRRK